MRTPAAILVAFVVFLGHTVDGQQPPRGQSPTNLGTDANGNPLRLALKTGHVSNYDEAKVRPYQLPNLLVGLNGRRITDARGWRERRAEIVKLYETEIYGRVPVNAPKVTWQVGEIDRRALDGTAIMKKVIGMGAAPDGPRINVNVYTPAGAAGPVHFNGATALSPAAQAPSAAPSTPAVPDPKSTVVPRLGGQVTIDGVLDEQVWENAPRLTPFVKHDTMGAARVATEVRIWNDEAALYLGWICEDADIQATFTERDSRFWEEEVVEFFVTPGALDRYFELQWNPLGGTFDAIISNEIGTDGRSQRFKGDWSYTAKNMTFAVKADGSVQNSTDRDRRWTVEVRIPFADLNVKTPAAGDVWRANFYRFNRDQGADAEQLSWSPTIWPGFHQPNRFGYLRFAGASKP